MALLGLAAYVLFIAIFFGCLFIVIRAGVKAGITEYFNEKESRDDTF